MFTNLIRPLCSACNQQLAAINYKSGAKTYYRKLCDQCLRKGKTHKLAPPNWYKAGYRKRASCDKCGWRAKYIEKQMTVFYIDGNLKNNQTTNLRSVCLNCRVEIAASKLPWRESPLTPDF
jgi:hypothetical protein